MARDRHRSRWPSYVRTASQRSETLGGPAPMNTGLLHLTDSASSAAPAHATFTWLPTKSFEGSAQ